MSSPDPVGELLCGAKSIARFLGLSPRQTVYLIERNRVPIWREGRRIFARRASLEAWSKEREKTGGDASPGKQGQPQ